MLQGPSRAGTALILAGHRPAAVRCDQAPRPRQERRPVDEDLPQRDEDGRRRPRDSRSGRASRVGAEGQRSVRQVLSAMAARAAAEPRTPNGGCRSASTCVELRKRLFRGRARDRRRHVIAGMVVDLRPRRLERAERTASPVLAESPRRRRGRSRAQLSPTSPAPSTSSMQIAIVIGIVISSPIWLYQIFAFLVPGLTAQGEEVHLRLLLHRRSRCSSPGCCAGLAGAAAHRRAHGRLRAGEDDHASTTPSTTSTSCSSSCSRSAIAFVLPVFLVLLNFVGVLSAARRSSRAGAGRSSLIALFTAIATPAADVVSMFLLAIPMVVALLRRGRRRAVARPASWRGARRRSRPSLAGA